MKSYMAEIFVGIAPSDVFGFVVTEVGAALVMVSSTNLTNFKKPNIRALNN
jgi:hypothetical protein